MNNKRKMKKKMYLISRKAPWSTFIAPEKGRMLPLG
jgi:hypothetical protein